MIFYTYILFSEKLKGYYIGFTGDTLESRLYKHLKSKTGHTAKAKDWIIAHFEVFDSKELAMKREKEIKAWKSKIQIQKLIKNSSE